MIDFLRRYQGGYTALLSACLNGHLEMVQLLIALGADIRAANKVRMILMRIIWLQL